MNASKNQWPRLNYDLLRTLKPGPSPCLKKEKTEKYPPVEYIPTQCSPIAYLSTVMYIEKMSRNGVLQKHVLYGWLKMYCTVDFFACMVYIHF